LEINQKPGRINIENVEKLFLNDVGVINSGLFASRKSKTRGITRKLTKIKKQAKKLYQGIQKKEVDYILFDDDQENEEMY
jgi:hypothetical protein